MKLLSLVTYLLGGGVQLEVALVDVYNCKIMKSVIYIYIYIYIYIVAYLLGAQLEVPLDIRVMK